MRLTRSSLALLLALALPARAEDPPLDLPPLVPPKAPWLHKQAEKKKPPAHKPGARRKKTETGTAAQEPATGTAAQEPALELPPLVPLSPAAPPAAPVVAAPPAGPTPPGYPAPAPSAVPPPPLLKLSNQIGVLVQADAGQAALEAGLQSVGALAPLSQTPLVLPRPAQRCGDDACALALGHSVDQLIVASLQAGQLRLRVLDVAARQRVGDPQQATVKDDEAVAAAEAMACKLLVPAGCTGELKLTAPPSLKVEVDGAPLQGTRLPVGLHTLQARGAVRTIAIVHEAPLSLSLADPGAPAALIAEAPAAAVTAAPSPADGPQREARRWNKPAGLVAAGAGALAAGLGGYFGARSSADLGSAEAAYRAHGGYTTPDLSTLSSGNSSARTANALFATSAVLAAAGAVLYFAF